MHYLIVSTCCDQQRLAHGIGFQQGCGKCRPQCKLGGGVIYHNCGFAGNTMAQYSPEGLAQHSPPEFMANMHSQLMMIPSSDHTKCMYMLPRSALTPQVTSQTPCGTSSGLLFVMLSGGLEKQSCHAAKSNVLALSSYQAKQQASAGTHAAAHGCTSMSTHLQAIVYIPVLPELLHICAGKLMFLHTNMSPKWNLAIPADFSFYSRRWQVGCGHTPAS